MSTVLISVLSSIGWNCEFFINIKVQIIEKFISLQVEGYVALR